jgi:NAD(P)-dependent dehydrogenase (short-subunit alcohol dehydrogenase family)
VHRRGGRRSLGDRRRRRRRRGVVRRAHGPLAALVEQRDRLAQGPRQEQPLDRVLLEQVRRPRDLAKRAGATLLLDVLQALSPDLAAGGRVLAVSEMGGSYGRDGRIGPAGPLAGAVLGAVNVVAAEWAPELARAVDLPAGLDPDEMAEIAAAELAAPGPDREIGYPDRERTRFVARATPDDEESRPEAESEPPRVLLATGGARGITAESVLALAGPETTVICVGRTPHPDGAGPDPAPDARDEAALRGAIAAAEPGIGPQELSRRARSVLAARELRENLTRLAGAAGDVRYVTADVRDAEALAAALGPVLAETGPADTVLHGAGLIEDRRIERKTPESLARVFDTKVDGLEAVLATVDPEALRRLILFTSVSGRFGTPGQLDYAAANEVLNRMAWGAAERWPWVRVRAINWGPWSGGGMADDAVLGRLAERGIAAIDPDAGRAALHGAVAGEGPVELIVGSGPWLEAE